MRNQYQKIFRDLKVLKPKSELCDKILNQIALRQNLEARFWYIILGTISLGSLLSMLLALQYTFQELYLSNFYQYMSIIMTDGINLTSFFKEFVLSLTESIPLFGLTVLLSTTFILLYSIKLATEKRGAQYLSA